MKTAERRSENYLEALSTMAAQPLIGTTASGYRQSLSADEACCNAVDHPSVKTVGATVACVLA
ncbi:hypothetical protein [Azohydromonas caseinilytica]|uniref:Uncharacterized protein n=1 Tax=Azohydromonas caseinilytica TaxID=2728836 RepID=A0A848FIX7_9BURK|nr:hypothetical protein [Azohydromonas caseinilytica]NML18150.1 hypothetical protein [Azohydromonas caseinilytica]